MRHNETAESLNGGRLERVVEEYEGALLGFAQNKVFNKQDAEEIVNDVFYRFFKHYDPEKGREKTWLYRVTDNLCKDHMRQRHRNNEKAEVVPSMDTNQIPNQPKLKEENDTRIGRLKDFIETLSDEKRAIFKLFYEHWYSQEEIAEMLSIKRGTVAKHISDIKGMAKAFLER